MGTDDDVKIFSGGEITLWTENDRSIHLRAVTSYGDPVELSAEEARELAAELLKLSAQVE